MSNNNTYWLVSVPNEVNHSSEDTLSMLKRDTASTKCDLSLCSEFQLPPDLLVGTLNSLMALSDELNRVDMSMESVVRKIERQFQELNATDTDLTVDGKPIDRYLQDFSWDEAKHPHRRPLAEIVSIIQSSMGKVEDELKQLSAMFAEKKQAKLQLERKKGGNLMVANLDDVLTADNNITAKQFPSSEYLQTLVAVVPKALEQQWLEEYVSLGNDIAEFGPAGARGSEKGSPAVPNSSQKLYEEGDACLYTVTLLKGQYQPGFVDEDGKFEQGTVMDYIEQYKTRAREKRFIIRDFTFSKDARAQNEAAKAGLEVEVDRLWSSLLRWCKAHFGEAYIAWIHIKAIRVFVESVLRYGLPVNFVVALFRPHSGKEKKLRSVLGKKYSYLQPENMDDDESTSAGSAEFFPYVTNSFNMMSS